MVIYIKPLQFLTLLFYSFTMVSTFEIFFVLHVGMGTTSGRKLPKKKECNLSIGINMLVRCVVGFKLDIA